MTINEEQRQIKVHNIIKTIIDESIERCECKTITFGMTRDKLFPKVMTKIAKEGYTVKLMSLMKEGNYYATVYLWD